MSAATATAKPRATRDLRFVLHPESDANYVHFENGAQHPFTASQSAIGRRNAWWLADAALLSYWAPDIAIARFRSAGLDASFVPSNGAQCYVSVAAQFVIVSFRGTQVDEWQDIYDDSRFKLVEWGSSGTRVHQGFKEAYERVKAALSNVLAPLVASHTVWFTGHSLGGALAVLAADEFGHTEGVLTIGSPRVGDAAFTSAFDSRLDTRSLRYINHNDLVTHLPPAEPFGYRHVKHARRIDADGSVSSGGLGLLPSLADIARLGDLATGSSNAAPTPIWFSLLDHMPRGYAVDIWNDYARNGD